MVLPKGSMKVIGTRGLGFFTCLRIQPYRPPSVTFSFLVSPLSPPLIVCTAHTFFSFCCFVSFHPLLSRFLTSSLSCHNKPKDWWQHTWHSLIKLSSGKHFTTLQTRTHSSCYDSASCYWQIFTDILFFKIGF